MDCIVVVGDGTLTIPVAIGYLPWTVTATAQYRGSAANITTETQTGPAGTTFVFKLSSAGGAHCVNWVDIVELAGPAGTKSFGFGPIGATWVLS